MGHRMAAKYYLKLFHEMLDDPKVARLPDSSYRRFIECLLLAGETYEGGYLPPLMDMAWRLRLDETSLSDDMTRLALSGLVEIKPNGRWFVTKFAERQAPVSDAERQQRSREASKKREYHEPSNAHVTNCDTDKDKEEDSSSNGGGDFSEVVAVYENEIGLITPSISEQITAALSEFPKQYLIDAIQIAVTANKRNWRYVNGILKNWRVNGRQDAHAPKPTDSAELFQKLAAAASRRKLDGLTEQEKEIFFKVGGVTRFVEAKIGYEYDQLKKEVANAQ